MARSANPMKKEEALCKSANNTVVVQRQHFFDTVSVNPARHPPTTLDTKIYYCCSKIADEVLKLDEF